MGKSIRNRTDRPRGRPKEERLARVDWEDAALAAIAAGGLAGVRVEPLAAELGVTKGSFYWHFDNREALVEAALVRWVDLHGAPALVKLERIEDPRERLRTLLRQAVQASLATTVQARLLSEVDDERVRRALREVTDARLALLRATFAQLGFAPDQAAERALATYATYLGLLQLAREGSKAWKESLAGTLDRLMTSPG